MRILLAHCIDCTGLDIGGGYRWPPQSICECDVNTFFCSVHHGFVQCSCRHILSAVAHCAYLHFVSAHIPAIYTRIYRSSFIALIGHA